MNYLVAFGFCLLLLSCGGKEKKTSKKVSSETKDTTTTDSNAAFANKDTTVSLPSNAPMKSPTGVYQFILPYNQQVNIEHTISFYNNNYRLQEIYKLPKKDSAVITRGTWAISDGYIWLYKDQVAAGRYIWKGDTLQYFNPVSQKNFSMKELTPAQYNTLFMDKKAEGAAFYGTGNDVPWTLQLTKQDTLTFSLPAESEPVRVKLLNIVKNSDSTVYIGQSNALKLRVVVLPYFCTDGMGNFVYNNRIQVHYNGKTYSGCGTIFK